MPECDGIDEDNRKLEYNQRWLKWAIPPDATTHKKVAKCIRYAPIAQSNETKQCAAESFNRMQRIPCTEYVYKTDERNIQTEVSLPTPSSLHSELK